MPRHLKRKIAYSSISHMGFVLIGGRFSALGTSGAMLQMISHGLIGASLFFLVGATYDRTHTLQLDEMGASARRCGSCSRLDRLRPGVPGTALYDGFVSELMVFAASPPMRPIPCRSGW